MWYAQRLTTEQVSLNKNQIDTSWTRTQISFTITKRKQKENKKKTKRKQKEKNVEIYLATIWCWGEVKKVGWSVIKTAADDTENWIERIWVSKIYLVNNLND